MKNLCVVLFIIWFAGPACGSGGGGGGNGGSGGGGGVTTPSPMIASINPTSGTAAGGTAVTITGSGFSGTATATIGSVALTNVSVSGGNTITGITGQSSTAGAMNVSITTGGQSPSLSNGFTYIAVLRAMINGTTNGSTTINHNTPTTFSAAQSTTTSPYTINGYSWNCGQDLAVYNSVSGSPPCQPTNNPITPMFSYRHCASTSNPPRQPCTSGSGANATRTYTMTLTVTDTQGNSNSTNYNVTVTNQY